MLTPAEFASYSANLAAALHPLTLPAYADYVTYENHWENYIRNCSLWIHENGCPQKLSLIAMESAPGAALHPGPNYIFAHLAHLATRPADNYLLNIHDGTFPVAPAAGLTKQQVLNDLCASTTNLGDQRPIVLFDLLPTHGVSLSGHPTHRTLARESAPGILWHEVGLNITRKLEFIFNNLLEPCKLEWEHVHIGFATPPNTINLPSPIAGFIAINAPGIHIHGFSINAPLNTAPIAANLQELITHHGF